MLGARGSTFIVFYSWESGDVVKKVDVMANVRIWYEYDGIVNLLVRRWQSAHCGHLRWFLRAVCEGG